MINDIFHLFFLIINHLFASKLQLGELVHPFSTLQVLQGHPTVDIIDDSMIQINPLVDRLFIHVHSAITLG